MSQQIGDANYYMQVFDTIVASIQHKLEGRSRSPAVQEENMMLERELVDGLQKMLQEGIELLAQDIRELEGVTQRRQEEEDLSNQSFQVAQTIQQFLTQNKSIFLSNFSQQN